MPSSKAGTFPGRPHYLRMRPLPILFLLFMLTLAALAYTNRAALWSQLQARIPPDYNPWATLDLTATPNRLTPYKLNRLNGDPATCRAVLDAARVTYTPMADRSGGACPLTGIVRVPAAGTSSATDPTRVTFNNSFMATCPVVAAWELFRRHELPALAHTHLGSPVTRVEHLGSYACRNIYGRADSTGARRSEHATANALDVRAFVTQNGQRVVLSRDWSTTIPEAYLDHTVTIPESYRQQTINNRFLRATRTALCRSFNTVLGPAYNAAHADHFHLDMGRFRVCR